MRLNELALCTLDTKKRLTGAHLLRIGSLYRVKSTSTTVLNQPQLPRPILGLPSTCERAGAHQFYSACDAIAVADAY